MSTLRDAITNFRVSQNELNQALDHELTVQNTWAESLNQSGQSAINNTLWSLRRELRSAGFSNQEIEALEKLVIETWKPKSHANVRLPEIKKERFIYPTRQLN